MWTHLVHMKTATGRDLRNNFSRLEAWLAVGGTVQIRKRGESVAELRKPSRRTKAEPPMPDFIPQAISPAASNPPKAVHPARCEPENSVWGITPWRAS
jgi:antitoxin (DNA-binding transcriptional repressor) of toxin-antitoxin stability system